MLEEPRSSMEFTTATMRPLVRVKVVPASFGLEGFAEAIWEAYEEEMNLHDDDSSTTITTTSSTTISSTTSSSSNRRMEEKKKKKCKAVTIIVAAPDLTDDPNLTTTEEGVGADIDIPKSSSSPQAEFEPDRFRMFVLSLEDKLREFEEEEVEGSGSVPLMDLVKLDSFHPLWKNSDDEECWGDGLKEAITMNNGSSSGSSSGSRQCCGYFPYPSVVVSTNVNV